MDSNWIFLTLIAIGLLITKYWQNINHWKRQNVQLISILEIFGKAKRRTWGLVISDYYRQMCEEQQPFKAIEGLWVSMVIVQDLDAVKAIMTNLFDSFPDRGFYVNHREALSTKLVRTDYWQWKPLRQKLAPAFTPAKIRLTFPSLLEVGERLVNVLTDVCDQGDQCLDILDLCGRYAIDAIGQTAFGIECNALKTSHTEFLVQGNKNFYQMFHPLFEQFTVKYSKLMQFLGLKVYDKAADSFYNRLVTDIVHNREKYNIRRNDYMDTLIKARCDDYSSTKEQFSFTSEILVGQAFLVFAGGFENTSSAMTYAVYELARNQDIQEKARKNILEIMAKYDQQLSYESVMEMKYIKQVLLETLRKYPILPIVTRVCRRRCTVQTESGSLTILPNTSVILPLHGIHHNPKLHPEPHAFRPERFADDEVNSFSYLAFGAGPKTCLGERFAMVQMTLGLVKLLLNFKFSIGEKTPREIMFDPKDMISLKVEGGVHLKVHKL